MALATQEGGDPPLTVAAMAAGKIHHLRQYRGLLRLIHSPRLDALGRPVQPYRLACQAL